MSERKVELGAVPDVVLTKAEACEKYRIKPRTLNSWIEKARPREVSVNGRRRTFAGNGLAAALLGTGRWVRIDEARFVAWLRSRWSSPALREPA